MLFKRKDLEVTNAVKNSPSSITVTKKIVKGKFTVSLTNSRKTTYCPGPQSAPALSSFRLKEGPLVCAQTWPWP